MRSCVGTKRERPKVVRIEDTLHLEKIWLSEAYWEIAKRTDGVVIEGEMTEMKFDEKGNLF